MNTVCVMKDERVIQRRNNLGQRMAAFRFSYNFSSQRRRMTHFLVTWAITALGLLIISQLRLGIEIKNIGAALVAALVLGVLNAIVRPILGFFALPITILTLGLFALVLNALMIMLMAVLVKGVHLRNGFWSALIGSILLGIFNAILTAIIF
jgi:putative membrane protein